MAFSDYIEEAPKILIFVVYITFLIGIVTTNLWEIRADVKGSFENVKGKSIAYMVETCLKKGMDYIQIPAQQGETLCNMCKVCNIASAEIKDLNGKSLWKSGDTISKKGVHNILVNCKLSSQNIFGWLYVTY